MSVVVGLLMVAALATAVARPLFAAASPRQMPTLHDDGMERLLREKNVALLAIKEAEFDRAMGKLSDNDCTSLRQVYEERALSAISKIDEDAAAQTRDALVGEPRSPYARRSSPEPAAIDAFCPACGRRFAEDDRFCGSCGRERGGA